MFLSKLFNPSKNEPQQAQITKSLLRAVCGFNANQAVSNGKAASYFFHYETLLNNRRLLEEHTTTLRDSNNISADVISFLVDLKLKRKDSLNTIRTWLQNNPPPWLGHAQTPQTIDKVLTFASRLWLFTRIELRDGNATLEDAARARLQNIAGVSTNAFVWLDFSANTMERAGFRIQWTSELSEHLTFASTSVVRVFSHASILERYETGI